MVFIKGQSGNPFGRKKGGKNKATIEREARRQVFDWEVSQKFEELIKQARPEYLIDQFMGTPTQRVEVNTTSNITITHEVIAIAEEELKRRKLNEQAIEAPRQLIPPEGTAAV